MSLPPKAFPFTCTLRRSCQNFILAYDTLTSAFTVGKILTGAASNATATIAGIPGTVVTNAAGATIYTVPANTLLLHSIAGTFQDNEALSDNGTAPGAALANGTVVNAFNVDGLQFYTNVDTALVACNIYRKLAEVKIAGQSTTIKTGTRIMLPATITPHQGDLVIVTQAEFAGTWTINSPDPKMGPGGVTGHWEADLVKEGT